MDIADDLMTKNDFSPAIVYIDKSYSRQYFMSMNKRSRGGYKKSLRREGGGREGNICNVWVSHKIKNCFNTPPLVTRFGRDDGGG